jgi:Flp pilus assembly protein TadB
MATSHVDNLPGGPANRSTGEIVQDILQNVQDIIRSEVQIAKNELADRGKQMGKAAGMLGGGLAMLWFAGALVIVTAVAALALVMPLWLASLIMAVLLGVVGGGMAMAGRQKLKQTSLKPEQAIQGVKEDVTWLKRQTR